MNRQGKWTNRDGIKGECAMAEQAAHTTHQTATLYYNPEQRILHTVLCEVNDLTGAHKVLKSEIENTQWRFSLHAAIKFYEDRVGEGNVRAYNITEVK